MKATQRHSNVRPHGAPSRLRPEYRRLPNLAILILALFSSAMARGASPPDILAHPAILASRMAYNGGGHAHAQVLPHAGPGGTPAIAIDVAQKPADWWNIQYMVPVTTALHSGDVVELHLQFRSAVADKRAALSTMLQYTHPPWTGLCNISGRAGSQWKTMTTTVTILKDIPPSQIAVSINLGSRVQRVLIAAIHLTLLGHHVLNPNFRGPWLKPALARIAQYRMAPLTVEVVDQQQRPLPHAVVHVQMLRHSFQFGAAVAPSMLTDSSVNGRMYRRMLLQYFNHVEIDNGLKWGPWHDRRRRVRTLLAVRWLLAHHLPIRGHNLIWPSWKWMPRYVKKLKSHPGQLRRVVNEHVLQEARAMAGKVDCWDVINEPLDNHSLQHIFGDSILTDCYKVAHRADPHAVLYVNEYEILGDGGLHINKQHRYARLIHYLLSHGAPLGGIGVQCHFWLLTPPRRIVRILNRFSRFGQPLAVTELTIDVPNRAVQAHYMRAFLIAAFSVPSVVGINQWGFWAGHDWRPNTALWNKHWQLRPVGRAYIQLVYHTWWTNKTGTTDAQGRYRVRGFLGDYQITTTVNGKIVRIKTRLAQPSLKIRVTVP